MTHKLDDIQLFCSKSGRINDNGGLYISTRQLNCSNAINPIRIYPIMMSITFHHYKILKQKNFHFGFDNSSNTDDMINYNNNLTTIAKQELDKWKNFSFALKKQNREFFKRMLQSSYKYLDGINTKGKEYSTESLLISLIFDQHKILLLNSFKNNYYIKWYLMIFSIIINQCN